MPATRVGERAVERLSHEAVTEHVRPLDLFDDVSEQRPLERGQRGASLDVGDVCSHLERETMTHDRGGDEQRRGIGTCPRRGRRCGTSRSCAPARSHLRRRGPKGRRRRQRRRWRGSWRERSWWSSLLGNVSCLVCRAHRATRLSAVIRAVRQDTPYGLDLPQTLPAALDVTGNWGRSARFTPKTRRAGLPSGRAEIRPSWAPPDR
jgi:hypothetical protein